MSALEQILAALFFCGLLAVLAWLLRKGKLNALRWPGSQSQSAGQIDVVARRPLTPQHTLHLVAAAGEMFLVVTHPHGAEIATFPASRRPECSGTDLDERTGH